MSTRDRSAGHVRKLYCGPAASHEGKFSAGSQYAESCTHTLLQRFTGTSFDFPRVILGLIGTMSSAGHQTVHELMRSAARWSHAPESGFDYMDGRGRYRSIPYLTEGRTSAESLLDGRIG